MSFGSWNSASNPPECNKCSWDNVAGCVTAEDCACVSQRPGMDDDGTTVWDKKGHCKKCSAGASAGDFAACGTGTKIFNQAQCPDKFKKKKQAKENDWACGRTYKLNGTNKEKEPNISWVYAVAAWALVLTCLNTCLLICMGIKVSMLSGGQAKGTTSNPVPASVLEKAAAGEPEVGYANYEKKGNNV